MYRNLLLSRLKTPDPPEPAAAFTENRLLRFARIAPSVGFSLIV
jgi:hypothetical protein